MKKNTPAKHKTPNYRLRTYITQKAAFGVKEQRVSLWEQLPLRSGRKDLS